MDRGGAQAAMKAAVIQCRTKKKTVHSRRRSGLHFFSDHPMSLNFSKMLLDHS